MSPTEIVRSMIAEHERKHRIHPQGVPFPRRGGTAVQAAYHDALRDVLAVLEKTEIAPHVQTNKMSVKLSLPWVKVERKYVTECWVVDTDNYHAAVSLFHGAPSVVLVGRRIKGVYEDVLHSSKLVGKAHRLKRIAELVIASDKKLQAQIERLK